MSQLYLFILFADDTTFLASHENLAKLIENINLEMTKIVHCLKVSKLSLTYSRYHRSARAHHVSVRDMKCTPTNVTR